MLLCCCSACCSRFPQRAPAATGVGCAACLLTAQYCWKPPERSKKSATSCTAQSRSMCITAAMRWPCTGKPCCRRCHARAHTSNAVYRPLLHMRVKASHPPPTCSQEPSCWLRTGTPCVKEGLLRSPPMYDGSGVDVMRSRLDLRQAGGQAQVSPDWLRSWPAPMGGFDTRGQPAVRARHGCAPSSSHGTLSCAMLVLPRPSCPPAHSSASCILAAQSCAVSRLITSLRAGITCCSRAAACRDGFAERPCNCPGSSNTAEVQQRHASCMHTDRKKCAALA